MKSVFLFLFALTVTALAQASDKDTVIICKKTKNPSLGSYKLYKVPPKSEREHIENVLMGGVSRLLVERPEQFTFVLKLRENRIDNTDGTTQFGGANIRFRDTYIDAISEVRVLGIDRVSGEMTDSLYLKDAEIDAWNKKHGGTPPRSGTWYYQCKNASMVF